MNTNNENKLEEYRSLHDEHMRNRSYIFERPIIVLGVIAVALPFMYESVVGQFILAFLIFILWYNLQFIGNRMKSDARIIAYIQMVHEPESIYKWIGWETSLREYRKRKLPSRNVSPSEQNPINDPQTFRFFFPIWVFHIILVMAMLTTSVITLFSLLTLYSYIGSGLALLSTIIFLYNALINFNPKRLNIGIEVERIKWDQVLTRNTPSKKSTSP
ncbi:MAG: hypothetical protein JW712_08740 [Dehalococcoidales bacterium]|nr:hypothetical protein [Dehalococcoidales bacterium]